MILSDTAHTLLTLTALSGECSTEVPALLGVADSYREKFIRKLRSENLIKTHSRDGLKGYRLTPAAKEALCFEDPDRFFFFLTGSSDTNRPRSDLPRRMRLQNASVVYATLLNAGVTVFRDKKPPLFHPGFRDAATLPLPVFYHSREVKELGDEHTKIGNSRMQGILLAPGCIHAVFYTGDSLLKWEYRTELRVKAMLGYHVSRGVLSGGNLEPAYGPDTPVSALFIGRNMDTALKLMTSTGGSRKSYFCLDKSFDRFHYVPLGHAGEVLLRVLCSPRVTEGLGRLLLSDLHPPRPELALEHDAVTDDGLPVLLAFDFDMLRLVRFHTALSFQNLKGRLICFDFQAEVLKKFFADRIETETIDLGKFERRFLPWVTS